MPPVGAAHCRPVTLSRESAELGIRFACPPITHPFTRMGAEGRMTATARYSLGNVAAELEAYYLELRGELPPPAALGDEAIRRGKRAPARV